MTNPDAERDGGAAVTGQQAEGGPMAREEPRGRVTRGHPYPMGVTPDGEGVNVAVWAPDAERVDFCLFPLDPPHDPLPSRQLATVSSAETSVSADSAEGERAEAAAELRFPLPFRDGEVWYAHISGVRPGDRYGLRAHGPWDPGVGLLFNPHKLLVDPHARALTGPLRWDPLMVGHTIPADVPGGEVPGGDVPGDDGAGDDGAGDDGAYVSGEGSPGGERAPAAPGPPTPDRRDSAPVVPRAIVMPTAADNPTAMDRPAPASTAADAQGTASASAADQAATQVAAHPTMASASGAGPDPAANRPGHAMADLVIYEAHVRGLTAAHPDVPAAIRGTYLGAAHPAVIDHLTRLGITAVEFLPLQAFIDDRHLAGLGLSNYWGYQPLAWCAPEPRYATAPQRADSELRHLVHTLHDAGIEVIVDVVYNHSGEGDVDGPTLGPRGLHNTGYYRLNWDADSPYGPSPLPDYVNDTGTGNTLAVDEPGVLRLVMDSLRHWARRYGVDGFRFDLAATLGRGPDGFDARAAFFQALAQDPELAGIKLIAEPWDLGPGGYRLGGFPHPFSEWNDTFRDGVRRLWRGESAGATDLGSRLLGSASTFDDGRRPATASVNFVSAHDGFTLADVVSYANKHNEANGEDGADGHDQNFSDNLGVEGPTDDPGVLDARRRRVRGMLATLLVSQGVPMLLAGDEMGNSQGGNNNAYAQDNPIGWVDWSGPGPAADPDLPALVARLVGLRRRFPQLRQPEFLHGNLRADGLPDVQWRRPDGQPPAREDWDGDSCRALGVELRGAAGSLAGHAVSGAVFVVINPGPETDFALPGPAGAGEPEGPDAEAARGGVPAVPPGGWRLEIDTARPADTGTAWGGGPAATGPGTYPVAAQSVVVLSRP